VHCEGFGYLGGEVYKDEGARAPATDVPDGEEGRGTCGGGGRGEEGLERALDVLPCVQRDTGVGEVAPRAPE